MRWAWVVVLVWAVLGVGRVLACSFLPRAIQGVGVLGVESFGGEPGTVPPLPRNAAFVIGPQPLTVRAGGTELMLEPLGPEPREGELGLATPPEPLIAGSVITVNDEAFRVGNALDEQAPEPPGVSEGALSVSDGEGACSSDSCGDFASVTIPIEAGLDEQTPRENLLYAIYFGRSPSGARGAARPVALALLEDDGLFAFVDFEWGEGDVYASVTTLDMAGNESERSEPIRVYDAPSGCAAIGAHHAGSSFALVLAALGLLARRRRPSR